MSFKIIYMLLKKKKYVFTVAYKFWHTHAHTHIKWKVFILRDNSLPP